jgi:ubiquinone/menaquinone biosynthesis C-methylase UbiE
LQTRGGHNRLVCADAIELPFTDECFDAALCSAALHHFENPDQALVELHRVLQDGGELLLTVPDRFPKTTQADESAGKIRGLSCGRQCRRFW